MGNKIKTWKEVFSNWKYLLLTAVIVLIFYSLNVLISVYRSLLSVYPDLGFFGGSVFFFRLLIGFKDTVTSSSFLSLIIISLLFGILVTLFFYKSRLTYYNDKNISILSGIGLFLGAFAPGCAACGVGLAAALGLGAGFLSFLPYKGLELSIIAIIILGYAIIKTTNSMYTCKIKKPLKGGVVK